MNGINKLQTLVSRFTTTEKSKEETSSHSFGVDNKIIYQKKRELTPSSIAHKIKKLLSKSGHATAEYFIASKKIQDLSNLKNKNPQSDLPASKSVQFKFETKQLQIPSDHVSETSENQLTSVGKQTVESKLKNETENIQTQPAELLDEAADLYALANDINKEVAQLETTVSPQYPLYIDAVPVIEHQIILTPMQLPQQAVIFKPNEKVQKVSLGEKELSSAKLSPKREKINASIEGSAKMNPRNKTNLTNTPSVHIGQHRPRLPDREVEKRINSVKDDISKKGLDKKLSPSIINNYLDVFRERLSNRGPATSTDITKMEDYQTVSQLLQDQDSSHAAHTDTYTEQELDIDRLIDEKNLMADIDNVKQKLIEEILKNTNPYKD